MLWLNSWTSTETCFSLYRSNRQKAHQVSWRYCLKFRRSNWIHTQTRFLSIVHICCSPDFQDACHVGTSAKDNTNHVQADIPIDPDVAAFLEQSLIGTIFMSWVNMMKSSCIGCHLRISAAFNCKSGGTKKKTLHPMQAWLPACTKTQW